MCAIVTDTTKGIDIENFFTTFTYTFNTSIEYSRRCLHEKKAYYNNISFHAFNIVEKCVAFDTITPAAVMNAWVTPTTSSPGWMVYDVRAPSCTLHLVNTL